MKSILSTVSVFSIFIFYPLVQASDIADSPVEVNKELRKKYTTSSIVVSSKQNLPKSEFSSSIEIIDDLEGGTTALLPQKLMEASGVFITQAGGPGSQSTLHIRGSDSRHVLVLIDGFRVNDPSTTAREANISSLSLGEIDRIEVIKGAQGLLYGSDALGGVINIITKRKLKKNALYLSSGFSNQIGATVGAVSEQSSFYINQQYDKTQGISSLKGGRESDAYINRNSFIRIHKNWNKQLRSEAFIKLNNQFFEYDLSKSVEAGFYGENDQKVFSHKLIQKLGKAELIYRSSLNLTDRDIQSGAFFFNYQGRDQVNEVIYKHEEGFILGVENINESFKQTSFERESAYLNSLYFMKSWNKESYFGQFGARYSKHRAFGENTSLGLGIGRNFDNSILKLNYQGGFKAPSLYQIYGENLDLGKRQAMELRPEVSNAVELSYEMNNSFETSLFYTHIDDCIASSFTPVNRDYIEISGIEFKYYFNTSASLTTIGLELYQYFNPNSEKRYRLPNERLTLSHTHYFKDNLELSLNFQAVGRRYDQDFSDFTQVKDVTLKPYSVTNLSFKQHFKNFDLTYGVDNIFNNSYELVYNYSTLGRTGYVRLDTYF